MTCNYIPLSTRDDDLLRQSRCFDDLLRQWLATSIEVFLRQATHRWIQGYLQGIGATLDNRRLPCVNPHVLTIDTCCFINRHMLFHLVSSTHYILFHRVSSTHYILFHLVSSTHYNHKLWHLTGIATIIDNRHTFGHELYIHTIWLECRLSQQHLKGVAAIIDHQHMKFHEHYSYTLPTHPLSWTLQSHTKFHEHYNHTLSFMNITITH